MCYNVRLTSHFVPEARLECVKILYILMHCIVSILRVI